MSGGTRWRSFFCIWWTTKSAPLQDKQQGFNEHYFPNKNKAVHRISHLLVEGTVGMVNAMNLGSDCCFSDCFFYYTESTSAWGS